MCVLRQSSWRDVQDYSEMPSDDVEIQKEPMSEWGYGPATDAEQEVLRLNKNFKHVQWGLILEKRHEITCISGHFGKPIKLNIDLKNDCHYILIVKFCHYLRFFKSIC